MLRINRLRVEITTINGVYGIDETFQNGVNFIASLDNTSGKSSVLAAIYYCLGFEQILGGTGGIGSKVLTSAFKTFIEDNGKPWSVNGSGAYLEISNGRDNITIYRNIKSENKDNRLVTVYYGDYNSIGNPNIISEDFYVNITNSAVSEKGFHTFLAEFLDMELPLVRTSDGNERKLYLQVVFAVMLIEQKHGWSDILSGMPSFGIREPKTRIVEYILGLETLKNEKERDQLSALKAQITRSWNELLTEVKRNVSLESCEIHNFPESPILLSEIDISRISVTTTNSTSIEDEIESLNTEYENLHLLKPRVRDNFESLNNELSETQDQILYFEAQLKEIKNKISGYNETIKKLKEDISIIDSDLRNNKDAARLQTFGSEAIGDNLSVNVCPVCKQKIQDNLLGSNELFNFMNIDENIKHLNEQKKMLEFTLGVRCESCSALKKQHDDIEERLYSLRRLAQTLRSDLYTTTDTDASEALMLKRIEISSRIEKLNKLKASMPTYIQKIKKLSSQWNKYLERKNKLPKNNISDSDKNKIQALKNKFIDNLKLYNYSSLSSFEGIDISFNSSLLPTIDGFDMKFDSSASDNIRVIWAFTLALLQVSIENNGNHPGLIVFDEPAQHSIVSEDMKQFIDSAIKIGKQFQMITAMTLNSEELKDIIDKLDKSKYKKIVIEGKAFKRL